MRDSRMALSRAFSYCRGLCLWRPLASKGPEAVLTASNGLKRFEARRRAKSACCMGALSAAPGFCVRRGTTGAGVVLDRKHAEHCRREVGCGQQGGQAVRHHGAALSYLAASSSFEPPGRPVQSMHAFESAPAAEACRANPDRVLGKWALFMIFRLEALPEQTVRQYFLQVKKLTFKRTPGSRYAFPTQVGP